MPQSQIVQTRAEGARTVNQKLFAGAWGLFLVLCLLPGMAHATDCSGLPTSFTGNEFPNGDFFTNFNNPCYAIPLGTGNGGQEYGDLNARYYQMYYKVDPRYQLILVGTFPNARYYSVTLYDEHSALAQSILDTSIVPLTSQYVNPYVPGVSFVDGQQFAVPVSFGGTPGTIETGCAMNAYNVSVNGLDATQRHPGMDWNTDAGVYQAYPNFAYHVLDTGQHMNPNTAGVLMIRVYLDNTVPSYDTNPRVIVRDVASGCAYPMDYALNTLQMVTDGGDMGRPWLDQTQIANHHVYETTYLPKLCNAGTLYPNRLPWARVEEYVPGTNPDASYVAAAVQDGLPATLAAAGQVMRFRVRIPTTPPTPCSDGCSRSGKEQMRYMSLSFQEASGVVLASVADSAFTQDANGYATLIVGTGATIPAWVTPANGYTYLDLSSLPDYQKLSLVAVRHMIPASDFNCAGQFIPYRTAVETPSGSMMGDYMPVADYPIAANLPPVATALVGQSTCGVIPAGQPGIRPACGVLPAPPPSVTAVVTECHVPWCSRFVSQSNPPITISGAGFGSFPNGIPFAGTSDFLRITNTTQNWTAGHTGDSCSVSVSSWDTGRIQLVANVNQNGACPIVSGDNLQVEVWNPQTQVVASISTTAW
jgi:hypothetical protein